MTKNENHNMFLDFAEAYSKKSKCVSRKVAAMLVIDDRVVGTGINGTPPGYVNCCEIFDPTDKNYKRSDHSKWSKDHEIHAEMNCILNSSKHSRLSTDMIMYSTHSPCRECLKNLSVLGIKKFYYRYEYDGIGYDPKEMLKFAAEVGIEMFHIKK